MNDKLKNFPPVYVTTIHENKKRIDLLKKSFEYYGINDINYLTYDRYRKDYCNVISDYRYRLNLVTEAVTTSHLKTIKHWVLNKENESVAFFCEDDLGLETVEYWNFNWDDFYKKLPDNWDCVQLVLVRDVDFFDISKPFRRRLWHDWSSCGYIMKKSFAKKLIKKYYDTDTFNLNYDGNDLEIRKNYDWAMVPVTETIVYSDFGNIYVAPLFVENVKDLDTTSVIFNKDEDLQSFAKNKATKQGFGHWESYEYALNWWKNGGFDIDSVKDI